MELSKQLLPIIWRQMAGILKHGIDESVGRILQGPAMGILKVTLLLRFISDPNHILLAGDRFELDGRIQHLQLCNEVLHTRLTTCHRTGMGREVGLSRKQLGEVLIHPMGDTTMLSASKGCQQTTITFGVLPDLCQALTHILPQLSQSLGIFKLLVHPFITTIIRQPA